MPDDYLPLQVNHGPWINAYTLYRLRELGPQQKYVLPVCSLHADYNRLPMENAIMLPPLFVEAATVSLRERLAARIERCFPVWNAAHANANQLDVVEFETTGQKPPDEPRVLAFSVDTAVEEHGPHLPLGTDTIQSYSVLQTLKQETDGFELARPLEYGQLTWGLPFGFSVDITTELLTEYVTGYVNALVRLRQPHSLYVVDVHGSIAHRQAIVDGLRQSECNNWAFRWLHEPLAEFAPARGDQHAGGVETVLVQRAGTSLIDESWWPAREPEIVRGQMSLEKAVELTPDLEAFCRFVYETGANGIVGDVRNGHTLDADLMFDRMVSVAREDVARLIAGEAATEQGAGQDLW